MATKYQEEPVKSGVWTWEAVEFYLIMFLYGFEYLFQVCTRFIVGAPKYEEESVNGKFVIVTGANSGLGKATAYELARRGATVIMAGRNSESLAEAAQEIRKRTSEGKLHTMILDLADLKSVHKFAVTVMNKYPRIDILINNAGLMHGGAAGSNVPEKTKDGFEIHFGTNYLGHFHLTNLLTDHLQKGASSRVINVSSTCQAYSNFTLDDITSERHIVADYKSGILSKYDIQYANSKLANSYFTKELSRRLTGKNVSVFTVCPGAVVTKILRSTDGLKRLLISLLLLLVGQTPEHGCETIIYCALSKECLKDSGRFFRLFKPLKSMDRLTADNEFSQKLWKASAKLVKVKH